MNFVALLIASESAHDTSHSVSPWLPEKSELIYGTAASVIIFLALFKFAGPVIKKAFADRTTRIQAELDDSARAEATAKAEAQQIRQAAGDVGSEKAKMMADANTEAEAVLKDGRERIRQEIMELNARADAEIASAGGRLNDELRMEISKLSSVATDRVFADGIVDDSVQQELIESFIARVGSAGGFAS